MTKKKDLKRIVRQRQERTGESYVTALRYVVEQTAPPAFSVVEMLDLTEEAQRLGLNCPVRMTSTLAERVKPSVVLERVRDALQATARDPATQTLRDTILEGRARQPRESKTAHWWDSTRRFVTRALAGIGGISEAEDMLALHVDTAGRSMMVIAHLGSPFSVGPTGALLREQGPHRGSESLLVLSGVDGHAIDADGALTALIGAVAAFKRV